MEISTTNAWPTAKIPTFKLNIHCAVIKVRKKCQGKIDNIAKKYEYTSTKYTNLNRFTIKLVHFNISTNNFPFGYGRFQVVYAKETGHSSFEDMQIFEDLAKLKATVDWILFIECFVNSRNSLFTWLSCIIWKKIKLIKEYIHNKRGKRFSNIRYQHAENNF